MTTWAELSLDAVDDLTSDGGFAIRRPFVRLKGCTYHLQDEKGADPVLSVPVPPMEYEAHIKSGVWLPLPNVGAQRGHVVLLASTRFQSCLPIGAQTVELQPIGNRLFAYRPISEIIDWRTQAFRVAFEAAKAEIRRDAMSRITTKARLDRMLESLRYLSAHDRELTWQVLVLWTAASRGSSARTKAVMEFCELMFPLKSAELMPAVTNVTQKSQTIFGPKTIRDSLNAPASI